MRKITICAPFDPVSEEEIRGILAIRKREHPALIELYVSAEGTLDRKVRTALLKKAVSPWRRLQVTEQRPADCIVWSGESEKIVREGRYDLAARGIRRILAEKGLYLEATVDAMCSAHRAAHTRSVAGVCRELAEIHGLDPFQAWQAGMMHDLTKGKDDEYNRRIVAVHYPDKLALSPKVWHSYSAPVFLHDVMGVRSRKILSAVEHHTLGDGTGDLDRILYIADKIEPLRGYDTSRQRAAAEKDLEQAAEMVLGESKQYILEKEGIHV